MDIKPQGEHCIYFIQSWKCTFQGVLVIPVLVR